MEIFHHSPSTTQREMSHSQYTNECRKQIFRCKKSAISGGCYPHQMTTQSFHCFEWKTPPGISTRDRMSKIPIRLNINDLLDKTVAHKTYCVCQECDYDNINMTKDSCEFLSQIKKWNRRQCSNC